MRYFRIGLAAALTAALTACIPSNDSQAYQRPDAAAVSVTVTDSHGFALPSYPIATSEPVTRRAYLEARRGEEYSLTITNRTGVRLGAVIAVDGRNVLSGAKSTLSSSERMYVLAPFASARIPGWRVSDDVVRRFYFTRPSDSYAGRFGDKSAMGVIAVAAYQEHSRRPLPRWSDDRRHPPSNSNRYPYNGESSTGAADTLQAPRGAPRGAPPSAGLSPLRKDAPSPSKSRARAPRQQVEDAAGTGFGRRAHDPTVQVAFRPHRHPLARHFVKYEWRETLVRLGVLTQRNRLWPDRFTPAYQNRYVPTPPDDVR